MSRALNWRICCVLWLHCGYLYASSVHVCLCICTSITKLFLHRKVTIDLEIHLAKRTKTKPSGGPLARYEVYLYGVPGTEPTTSNWPRAKAANRPSRAKDRVLRWEDDMYPPSPPCSICSPASTQSLPVATVEELQGSRPRTLNPYTP